MKTITFKTNKLLFNTELNKAIYQTKTFSIKDIKFISEFDNENCIVAYKGNLVQITESISSVIEILSNKNIIFNTNNNDDKKVLTIDHTKEEKIHISFSLTKENVEILNNFKNTSNFTTKSSIVNFLINKYL